MKTLLKYIILAWACTFAWSAPVTIDWDAEPDVAYYEVWRGLDKIATVNTNSSILDLPTDRKSVIAVRVINSSGTSEFSDPLIVVPVTPRSSPDLATWTDHPIFFAVEIDGRMFLQFTHPK
jgi:hypothetical protein